MIGDTATTRTTPVRRRTCLAAAVVGHVAEFLLTLALVVAVAAVPVAVAVATARWCGVPDGDAFDATLVALVLSLPWVALDALLAVVAWLAAPRGWPRRSWTAGLLTASLVLSLIAEYRTGLPVTSRCGPGRGPWWWPFWVPWLT